MSTSDMQVQRDQALACFILALCIALAVFLSVFGKQEALNIRSARDAVAAHETLLRQSYEVLKQNQDSLSAVRAALKNIERAERR
jgi:uncharacterized protein HemX